MTFDLNAEEIARRALDIASQICVYTNNQIVIESIRTA
jgi:ATP-dependent protease HslVU (ClpYQ) peptidase subunit